MLFSNRRQDECLRRKWDSSNSVVIFVMGELEIVLFGVIEDLI